jgi:RHH-type proline utilization regulon transcriptional repressor/proline dehydrogenase/delta 1-pyrroline-5-carboxylate dehydrogenase
MLGEGARSAQQAADYLASYTEAIHTIGKKQLKKSNNNSDCNQSIYHAANVSIKLSALHPRYEHLQKDTIIKELLPKLVQLCVLAKSYGISISIDAEEADRLDLSLDLFSILAFEPELIDWNGLGLVVQAYQKRAYLVLKWLVELAKSSQRKIIVRLVKGAYWDTEIKHAQELGLNDYPVFTRKENTDFCYEVCASYLLKNCNDIYPQFATHNAYSLAYIEKLTEGSNIEFEFQRLHGMGSTLYQCYLDNNKNEAAPIRVYAPVGKHEKLLPYLVRRLLENGANSSFVNRFLDAKVAPNHLVKDTLELVKNNTTHSNPSIPLPCDLYRHQNDLRDNSKGLDLSCSIQVAQLQVTSNIPIVKQHSEKEIQQIFNKALAVQDSWQKLGFNKRADLLDKVAKQLEDNQLELISIITNEAKRTQDDSISEVREAIDFCRYYAQQARLKLATPIKMSGPTGESNYLSFHGKGVFVCISPWNFPLAIFMGQVMAALVTGNTVIAKPAEQTPYIAQFTLQLCRKAGIPEDVLQLAIGDGAKIAEIVFTNPQLAGVAFTGSTQTASIINQQLAKRKGSIATLIAETGGQNCMVTDSSVLLETLVDDVVLSAFKSAGQRCSAMRVLWLQEEVAESAIELLIGAMKELNVGQPQKLSTDVGPVIDQIAATRLNKHINKMKKEATLLFQTSINDSEFEHFVAPTLVELKSLSQLQEEVFGPVLHIIRYSSNELDKVIAEINNTHYNLTLGIHSRVMSFANKIIDNTRIGNTYINRNMIGAVVGAQPFGGSGLSGTGPKAGGPNYLLRFINERHCCENLVARGGNFELFNL